jgi:phosphatidylserine synthase
VLIGITSVLMVSRVPTPSLKYVKLDHNWKIAAYAFAAALIPAMIFVPWATLILGLVIYLGTIPFGIHAAAEENR